MTTPTPREVVEREFSSQVDNVSLRGLIDHIDEVLTSPDTDLKAITERDLTRLFPYTGVDLYGVISYVVDVPVDFFPLADHVKFPHTLSRLYSHYMEKGWKNVFYRTVSEAEQLPKKVLKRVNEFVESQHSDSTYYTKIPCYAYVISENFTLSLQEYFHSNKLEVPVTHYRFWLCFEDKLHESVRLGLA